MNATADMMVTLAPYRSRPPSTGGTKRIHFLNRGYTRHGWDVLQISGASTRAGVRDLLRRRDPDVSPAYREQIYFNPALVGLNRLYRRLDAPQIAAATLPRRLRSARAIARALADRRVVMLEHPTWFDMVVPHLGVDHFLVLDAHNIEYRIFAEALARADLVGRAARALHALERRCFARADLVFTCSEADREIAISELGIAPGRVFIAPNGVDIETTPPITDAERREAKRRLGLGAPVAAFVGSRWPPNAQAVAEIVKLAAARPELTWLVIGQAGEAFARGAPPNVVVTGAVADLRAHLAAADVAVNPMVGGSGSNIKMFEYLALGLPVVATPFGARGVDDPLGLAVVRAELAGIPDALVELVASETLAERRAAARALAERSYDWTAIAGGISDTIRARLAERR